MSESDLRSTFHHLTRALDPHPIENLLDKGTPDEWILTGAVELKWLREWPARAKTPVRLPHFTQEQKLWLSQRWAAGGGAWMLLQCKREWLIFCPDDPLFFNIGTLTADQLRLIARPWFKEKPSEDQLCRALRRI